ncbi:MAG: S8 family serine peptidase [Acidobacteriota bacterium]
MLRNARMKLSVSFLATLVLLVAVVPVTALGGPIDQLVLDQLAARGKADIFVKMAKDASLDAALSIQNLGARRQYVHDTLVAQADRTQQGVRSLLSSRGFGYKVFWINNSLFVKGADRALVQELARRADVAYVRGNHERPLDPVVFEPDTGTQAVEWNIEQISAPDVWAIGNTGQDAVVANIDTGVRYTHEALVGSYRGNLGGGSFDHNYNWFDPTGICGPVPCDNNNHGSHTMGTMVGGDGPGPFSNDIGVAPGAQWIACKGCESSSCTEASLLACGQFMACPTRTDGSAPDCTKAPDVVNNSWGGGSGDTFFQGAVNSWLAAGIMPVFSAGNSGPSCSTVGSPGDYRNVIAVGATTSSDVLASFSSKGPGAFSFLKPNVVAPGSSVRSSIASSDTSYGFLSGTSMAAPHVGGTFALMMTKNPTAGLRNYIIALYLSAFRGLGTPPAPTSCGGRSFNQYPNAIYGFGRIDAFGAVGLLP